MNQSGILETLQLVNHFFIPIFQDNDTIRSSVEFHQLVKNHIVANNENFKSMHFFFNRVPRKNKVSKIRKSIEKIGAVVPSIVYDYKAYERKLRSTIFPIPLKKERNPFVKEATFIVDFSKDIHTIISEYYPLEDLVNTAHPREKDKSDKKITPESVPLLEQEEEANQSVLV